LSFARLVSFLLSYVVLRVVAVVEMLPFFFPCCDVLALALWRTEKNPM